MIITFNGGEISQYSYLHELLENKRFKLQWSDWHLTYDRDKGLIIFEINGIDPILTCPVKFREYLDRMIKLKAFW